MPSGTGRADAGNRFRNAFNRFQDSGNAAKRVGFNGGLGGGGLGGSITGGFQGPGVSGTQSDNAFFDAALARRGRALEGTAAANRTAGLGALEARGLGSGSAVTSLLSNVNRIQGLGLQDAAQDISGQQFALRQDRIGRQEDFQRQVALMQVQKKLNEKKKKGLFGRILGGVAGAAGGFLIGGPAGAVAGGAKGLLSE